MDDDEAQFFSRAKRKHVPTTPHSNGESPQTIDSSSASDSDTSVMVKRKKGKLKQATTRPEVETTTFADSNDAKNSLPSGTEVQVISDTDSDAEHTRARGRSARVARLKARVPEIITSTRTRRRSGSLTPPPQISPSRRIAGSQILQNVMAPLLSKSHRLEDNYDAIQEDEAELLFEAQMRQHAQEHDIHRADQGASTNDLVRTASTRGNSASEIVPDTLLDIVIAGVYVDSPASKEIIPDIQLWEKPRLFRIRMNTKISIAKISFCKEAGMCHMVNKQKVVTAEDVGRHEEIVLVHRDVRLFDYMTPHTLGIAEGEQPYFEAHTKAGWRMLETSPELRKLRQVKLDGEAEQPGASVTIAADEQEGQADFIKLILRASDGKELKARSKPSTKIDSLISGFRKVHSIPESYIISLYFEGDMLEGTLADTELETDDIVDVKIR